MEDCVFCKIVSGQIPSTKIWEDEKHLAFLTIQPIATGHTLVIPKQHEDYIFDLGNEAYSELLLKSKELAIRLKDRLGSKRIGLAVEGFGVAHVHVHLIPINQANEMDPHKAQSVIPEDLEKVAAKIRG